MSFILTHTGKKFDYEKPEQHIYDIQDIAHALGHQARFLGHTSRFYSVSEHSRLVSALLKRGGYSPKTQLWGLLHDLAEAYIGDMPTPLKAFCPKYKELEGAILKTALPQLCYRFSLTTEEEYEPIKYFDGVALALEVVRLMPKEGASIVWTGLPSQEVKNWVSAGIFPTLIHAVWMGLKKPVWPEEEKHLFLDQYYTLLKECDR